MRFILREFSSSHRFALNINDQQVLNGFVLQMNKIGQSASRLFESPNKTKQWFYKWKEEKKATIIAEW